MLRHVKEEEFEWFCLLGLFVYLLFLLDKEDLLLVIMETFCQRGTFGSKLTLNLSIYIFGQTFPDGFLGLGLSQSYTKQTLGFMKYSSYERLFFPVTEVMFLVNLDLVKQKKNPSSKLNLLTLFRV